MKETDDALDALRRKLTNSHTEGCGDVTFHRLDGNTVTIPNLRIDGIGVDHGLGKLGVVSATDEDDNIFTIPFVTYWTVEYK